MRDITNTTYCEYNIAGFIYAVFVNHDFDMVCFMLVRASGPRCEAACRTGSPDGGGVDLPEAESPPLQLDIFCR